MTKHTRKLAVLAVLSVVSFCSVFYTKLSFLRKYLSTINSSKTPVAQQPLERNSACIDYPLNQMESNLHQPTDLLSRVEPLPYSAKDNNAALVATTARAATEFDSERRTYSSRTAAFGNGGTLCALKGPSDIKITERLPLSTTIVNTKYYKNEILYSKARTDRSGMAIVDMLKAHAYAFKTNRTYGGACAREPSDKLKGRINQEEKLLASLGLQDVIKFACPPLGNSSTEEETVTGIHQIIEPSEYRISSEHLFTSSWISMIKSYVPKSSRSPGPLHQRANHQPLQVAVHVRRGDVDPCETYFTGKSFQKESRYLPNSYYQLVLERYLFDDVNSSNSRLGATSNFELSVHSVKKSFESWDN